jgi:hypothetical protein
LAFHPYPQLIRQFFNTDRFGPPRGLTPASPWPWIDHPVSGLQPLTSSPLQIRRLEHLIRLRRICRGSRPLQTRFRFGSGPEALNHASDRNSPVHSSIGTHSRSYGARTACRHTVSGSLSLRSRGAFHLSLTVLCAIGRQVYLALEGGPPGFPRDSTCPVVLGIRLWHLAFRLQGFHLLWPAFPDRFG